MASCDHDLDIIIGHNTKFKCHNDILNLEFLSRIVVYGQNNKYIVHYATFMFWSDVMSNAHRVSSEFNRFTELRRRLIEADPEIDESTLLDTLEGPPTCTRPLVRSSARPLTTRLWPMA